MMPYRRWYDIQDIQRHTNQQISIHKRINSLAVHVVHRVRITGDLIYVFPAAHLLWAFGTLSTVRKAPQTITKWRGWIIWAIEAPLAYGITWFLYSTRLSIFNSLASDAMIFPFSRHMKTKIKNRSVRVGDDSDLHSHCNPLTSSSICLSSDWMGNQALKWNQSSISLWWLYRHCMHWMRRRRRHPF